jgi:hypothetical protein
MPTTKSRHTSVWQTGNGTMESQYEVLIRFTLPELYTQRVIEQTFHVTPNQMSYDMIYWDKSAYSPWHEY